MLTTMNTDLMNDTVRAPQVAARIPAKRWGTSEDVAGVALFLAAPASDYVTGKLTIRIYLLYLSSLLLRLAMRINKAWIFVNIVNQILVKIISLLIKNER